MNTNSLKQEYFLFVMSLENLIHYILKEKVSMMKDPEDKEKFQQHRYRRFSREKKNFLYKFQLEMQIFSLISSTPWEKNLTTRWYLWYYPWKLKNSYSLTRPGCDWKNPTSGGQGLQYVMVIHQVQNSLYVTERQPS